jgi:hypothetical protein
VTTELVGPRPKFTEGLLSNSSRPIEAQSPSCHLAIEAPCLWQKVKIIRRILDRQVNLPDLDAEEMSSDEDDYFGDIDTPEGPSEEDREYGEAASSSDSATLPSGMRPCSSLV